MQNQFEIKDFVKTVFSITNDDLYSDERKRMNEIAFAFYAMSKEYVEKNDIGIYNVTHGGALEVYTRKNINDVLNS